MNLKFTLSNFADVDIEISQYAFENCNFEVKNENVKNALISAGVSENRISIGE